MGDAFAPIDASGFAAPANANLGAAPHLDWIALADCVVDRTYQREIGREGERTVRRIIAGFDWTHFAPLIVAPLPGGKFAVIDGQHRATAARALGCDRVPAMIVEADRARQAAAFAAVNVTITQVSALYVHRAKLAAGDPAARALADVCARAGVTIAPYPKASFKIQPGETLAVGALQRALKSFGPNTLITALMCITETKHNIAGAVHARVIRALCLVLDRHPLWRDAGGALLDAVEKIPLNDLALDGNAESIARDVAEALRDLLPHQAPPVRRIAAPRGRR